MSQITHLFQVDALGVVMVALILTIAWFIFSFSRIYLMGEAHLARHTSFFVLTICSAIAVALSNDLVVLALFWSLTGMAVERLLLFYPERAFAQIAARKSFILNRVADLAMIVSIFEIQQALHTTVLSEIQQLAPTIAAGNVHITIAALAAVLAVAIRCAQLPFHGWILQVMEAPTPVSALMHAGVVNIGGLVLLRLAPIIERTDLARDALIFIGGYTAIAAALVMTTRVSVKVSLAWSTCAQMGCMLVEAGIGAYPLVLLHLVGHSLYKSYAFLHAGDTVELIRKFDQTRKLKPPEYQKMRFMRVAAIVIFSCIGWFGGMMLNHDPALALGILLASLSIMHLINLGAGDRNLLPSIIAGSAALLTMYLSGERIAQLAISPAFISATSNQILLAGAAFVLLAVLDSIIIREPKSRLAGTLYAYAFAGFYIDELLTRCAMFLRLLPTVTTKKNLSPIALQRAAPVLQCCSHEMEA